MTRLLVLGMLDVQPMSGYDIQTMLKLSDAERWGGVLIGSIYHALKKLEDEGYAEVTSIEQTGHRQKAVYRITDSGRGYLRELVLSSLSDLSVQYPSSLYSGLSLYQKLSDKEALSALVSQKELLEKEYETVHQGLQAKKEFMQNSIPPMTSLIFEHMFSLIRLQTEFIDKIMQFLSDDK